MRLAHREGQGAKSEHMQVKELREKTAEELKKILASEREALRDLRFRSSQGQVKDVRDIRELRKNISRILTVLREGTAAK